MSAINGSVILVEVFITSTQPTNLKTPTRQAQRSSTAWSHWENSTHQVGLWGCTTEPQLQRAGEPLQSTPWSRCLPRLPSPRTQASGCYRLPKTGGKGTLCIPVHEVDWETLEGMPVGHSPPDGILKLLVACRYARGAFKFIGGQGW